MTSPLESFDEHLAHLQPLLPASNVTTLSTTPTVRAVYEFTAPRLPTAILHHSIRTFLLAHASSPSYARADLLYIAALFHDYGATSHCTATPCRFEVAGADAAAVFLSEQHAPQADIDAVWRAIALHTSAGIAERMGPPIDSVRTAVCIDFGKTGEADVLALKARAEDVWPRLEIEVCLGDAVVGQVVNLSKEARREKAPPASWPGILAAAHFIFPWHEGKNPAF